MEKIGKEIKSKAYWPIIVKDYIKDLSNEYHKHRLKVITDLLPKNI